MLEECDNTAADFSADPVHDLRVALRRCRSMADGMMASDPAPEWKEMKKAGKQLFQRLGDLRDIQIMMEWIDNWRQHRIPSLRRQTVRVPFRRQQTWVVQPTHTGSSAALHPHRARE